MEGYNFAVSWLLGVLDLKTQKSICWSLHGLSEPLGFCLGVIIHIDIQVGPNHLRFRVCVFIDYIFDTIVNEHLQRVLTFYPEHL